MRRLFLILFLLFVPVFFAEFLSTNTPITNLFQPMLLLLFVAVYGIPALLVFDAYLRWRLSWGGLLLLSLFFAFYIEGIVMKTFLFGFTPEPNFANYGLLFGIAVPWVFSMMISHGFISMFFPMLLARYYFGGVSSQPFLNKWMRIFLLILMMSLGAISFFFAVETHPSPVYFFVFTMVIVVITFVVRHFFAGSDIQNFKPFTAHPVPKVFLGAMTLWAFFWLTRYVADQGILPVLSVLLFILFITLCGIFINTQGWLKSVDIIVYALGFYIGLALLGITVTVSQGRFGSLFVNSVVILSLIFLIIRISKQKH